ncbi:MAG: hypothetical protein JO264_06855 [Acidisphaera sp.]|nr:hypothetical protein [Acidisphaera sp.]
MPAPEAPAPRQIRPETAQEIVRLSELYLDGLMRVTIAQDGKAASLAGILATASIALFGASAGLLLASPLPGRNIVLGAGLLATGLCLFAGAIGAIVAMRPRPFYVAGNYLREWSAPEDLYGDLVAARMTQARIYQEQIDENLAVLDEATGHLHQAMRFIFVAPFAGVTIGVMAYAAS